MRPLCQKNRLNITSCGPRRNREPYIPSGAPLRAGRPLLVRRRWRWKMTKATAQGTPGLVWCSDPRTVNSVLPAVILGACWHPGTCPFTLQFSSSHPDTVLECWNGNAARVKKRANSSTLTAFAEHCKTPYNFCLTTSRLSTCRKYYCHVYTCYIDNLYAREKARKSVARHCKVPLQYHFIVSQPRTRIGPVRLLKRLPLNNQYRGVEGSSLE